VQPGDYFEVQGGGPMHQITAVASTTANGIPSCALTLFSPLPAQVTVPTMNYRIERAPRVMGDEPESMPANIAIDAATNAQFGIPLPVNRQDGTLDILFSPKGEVLLPAASPPIILWIDDVTLAGPFQGAPTLMVVFPRSGKIAAFEVNPDPNFLGTNGLAYPYAFVQ
jgi:hypothetical protein